MYLFYKIYLENTQRSLRTIQAQIGERKTRIAELLSGPIGNHSGEQAERNAKPIGSRKAEQSRGS